MVYFILRCLYIYSFDITTLQNYTRQTCKQFFAKWFALCGEGFTVYRGNTIEQFVSTIVLKTATKPNKIIINLVGTFQFGFVKQENAKHVYIQLTMIQYKYL